MPVHLYQCFYIPEKLSGKHYFIQPSDFFSVMNPVNSADINFDLL